MIILECLVGSSFLTEFFDVPFRAVPQQTVYRSKKYRTIQTDLVLKTQFCVNRSIPKMHFYPFLTWNIIAFFLLKLIVERIVQR
jgi:hypothetical protein